MNSESVQVVKQVALDVEGDTVIVEMICSSELGASVLLDDLTERLKTGKPVTITLTAGQVIEGGEQA
ncbi:hypothetical protein ACKWRH_21455 [Bradyrhizobium sp. Pa8]|uniref:hypothetical protein n=1 Tax=Bradyrhizobium sp. Pa8 TaxID=3386552 RepID=UPI00403FB010